jgi:hypothetical protein
MGAGSFRERVGRRRQWAQAGAGARVAEGAAGRLEALGALGQVEAVRGGHGQVESTLVVKEEGRAEGVRKAAFAGAKEFVDSGEVRFLGAGEVREAAEGGTSGREEGRDPVRLDTARISGHGGLGRQLRPHLAQVVPPRPSRGAKRDDLRAE